MLLNLKLHHFDSKQYEAGTLNFSFCDIGLLSDSQWGCTPDCLVIIGLFR